MSCVSRTALVLLACLCVAKVQSLAAAEPAGAATPLSRWTGQSLSRSLRALEGPGVQFVFSSQLVPEQLRVVAEPPGGDALTVARALLAQHGLGLTAVEPGVYAVVRGPAAQEEPEARTLIEPLGEIVVSASRYRIGDAVSSVNLMDAETLRAQPGIGDDALRALQRLPGLAHDGNSARSNVRGGESSETLLLLDGYPLRQPFHLPAYQAYFSAIDSQLTQGAEVYTGGFPARYGNRMSGVFDLSTIDALAAPRRSLALDFFNASARVSGGRARDDQAAGYDWLASARVGTLKPVLSLAEDDIGEPSYSDGYARFGWGNPDGLRITANLLLSRDELGITREERVEVGNLESRARYLWLRADDSWGENLRATLLLGQTRIDSSRDGTANEPQISVGEVRDRRDSRLTDLRGLVAWQFLPTQLVEAGLELTEEDARYDYAATATFAPDVAALFGRAETLARDIDLHPERTRGSLFASWRWRVSDRLTTEIGGRAQRMITHGESDDWISEPRLGLRWQVTPDTRLQMSWGRYHQVDEINELDVEDGQTQFGLPQRSEHLIAGVEHRWNDRVGLRLEAYRKLQTSPRERYENLLDSQTVFPEIAPDRITVSPDRAEMVGVEVSASYDAPGLHAWGTLGWSRAEDRFGGSWTPRSWDQRWMAGAGIEWTRGSWMLGGQINLHEGWPATSLGSDALGNPVLGPRNGDRLDTFAQIDLRAQYTRTLQLGELVFVAELINASNRSNECCTELVVEDGRLAGEPLHWLPLVPSLGIRWNF